MQGNLYRFMWWRKGECVVEVLKRGHYPDTVMVKLPNDVVTEVMQNDLGDTHGSNARVEG